MLPAFLRQATPTSAKTFIPDLAVHETYFGTGPHTQPKLKINETAPSEKLMTEGIEAKMEETRKYFEELYRYEEPDGQAIEAMAEHYRDKILRNPHKCEGAILSENVLKQLVKAKTGKSPGPDLLPMEYYASHKDEIAPFLASYYNDRICTLWSILFTMERQYHTAFDDLPEDYNQFIFYIPWITTTGIDYI